MTNKERQRSLDKKKWLKSEKSGEDLSGAMIYCYWCKKQKSLKCVASQEERASKCLCATAYNRMQRVGR